MWPLAWLPASRRLALNQRKSKLELWMEGASKNQAGELAVCSFKCASDELDIS